MELIRPRARQAAQLTIFFLALVFSGGGLFAQSAGTPLSQEIKNAEAALNSPAQKEDALIRIARLWQLSGDIEAASKNWLAAARVENGLHRDNSLLMGAFCLAAMGEWEKASAAIAPLLRAGGGHEYNRARYLDACARAWLHCDASLLRAMADNAAYGDLRATIYYTLWKLAVSAPEIKDAGNAAEWKARLSAEFQRGVENRIASGTDEAALVQARPAALWLLMPRHDSASAEQAIAAPSPAPPPAPPVNTAGGRFLQTGLFSAEANAQNQVKNLGAAGFNSVINRKTVNGREFWAVTVPAGTDINRTIRELKNAGFDSFPL